MNQQAEQPSTKFTKSLEEPELSGRPGTKGKDNLDVSEWVWECLCSNEPFGSHDGPNGLNGTATYLTNDLLLRVGMKSGRGSILKCPNLQRFAAGFYDSLGQRTAQMNAVFTIWVRC